MIYIKRKKKKKIWSKYVPKNPFYIWEVHFLYNVLYACLYILNISWLKQMLLYIIKESVPPTPDLTAPPQM